ncbi:MAG: hypothetical protein OXC66_14720 [Roseovarius sp.]|nr:hypothetical protein [Roseovarius sp.]
MAAAWNREDLDILWLFDGLKELVDARILRCALGPTTRMSAIPVPNGRFVDGHEDREPLDVHGDAALSASVFFTDLAVNRTAVGRPTSLNSQ